MRYQGFAIYVLLGLVITLLANSAQTLERDQIGDQYIKSWVVGGPFPSANLNVDHFATAISGGEKAVATRGWGANNEIPTSDGRIVVLKDFTATGKAVDLVTAVGVEQGMAGGYQESVTAYAIAFINASKAETIEFGMGIDGTAVVWVNGVQVYRGTSAEKMAFDGVLVPNVKLKQGLNIIMTKVVRPTVGWRPSSASTATGWGFALRILPNGQSISIDGKVINPNGQPSARSLIRLYRQGQLLSSIQTNLSGEFRFIRYPAEGRYDLSATANTLGAWFTGADGKKKIEIKLENALNISGRLTMLDGLTPHQSITVEAVQQNEVMAKSLTNTDGNYQFINLKPGQYKIRVGGRANKIYYKNGTPLTIRKGKTVDGIDLRIPSVKKGRWRKYSNVDGLPDATIHDILAAKNGTLWLATDRGVTMYDGKLFETYTTSEGLVGNRVLDICSAEKDQGLQKDGSGGKIWFATDKGLSNFDGKKFKNYTQEGSDLPSNNVLSIYSPLYRDLDGRETHADIWIGTDNGLIRYNVMLNRFEGKKQQKDREYGIQSLPGNTIHDIVSDEKGDIWLATDGGAVRIRKKKINRVLTLVDGLPDLQVNAVASDKSGGMWIGTDGGAVHFNGEKIDTVLTTADGLFTDKILSVFVDEEKNAWFGSGEKDVNLFHPYQLIGNLKSGVTRYDDQNLTTFIAEDGPPSRPVLAIGETADGLMWFGSAGKGLVNFDDKSIVNYDTKDGLSGNYITAINQSKDGSIWIGTWSNGATIFDNGNFQPLPSSAGRRVSNITNGADGSVWLTGNESYGLQRPLGAIQYRRSTRATWEVSTSLDHNELGSSRVTDCYQGDSGDLWFANRWRFAEKGGVTHYKGGEFKRITEVDGLLDLNAWAISQSSNGQMLIGTEGGVALYDGNRITKTLQEKDGLPNNWVSVIYCEPKPSDVIWFGTGNPFNGFKSGLARYDGSQISVITPSNTQGGLASTAVRTIHPTADGNLWFGTIGGGASVYDPKEKRWAQLTTKNGLAGNTVSAIFQDRDGILWFGTENGLTRYNIAKNRSKVRIVSVKSDNDKNASVTEGGLPKIIAGAQVTINYSAIDFRVPFEKRRYQHRMVSSSGAGDWSKLTHETTVIQRLAKSGAYTFEVRFVDPQLKVSAPNQLELIVGAPPFHRTGLFSALIGGLTLVFFIAAGLQTHKVLQQRREIQEYQQMAVREVEDASSIQTDLFPAVGPEIEGFEIFGRCDPSSEVGGDFYDFIVSDNQVGVAVADVSGKGMQGAMNAVMASGVLHLAITETADVSPSSIVEKLNRILTAKFRADTNMTMIFGVLNGDNQTFTFVNAGQHALPILVRNGNVERIKHGGFPVGMKHPMKYKSLEFQFEPGDLLLLMSDGIIEPTDEDSIMYSETGKLETVLSNIPANTPLSGVIDMLIQDVNRHSINSTEPQDDITLIGIRATS